MNADNNVNWPHAPLHKLSKLGTYFITAGTYQKQHFFKEPHRLNVMQRGLLSLAFKYGWQLEAWAIFSNHYHFVAHSTNNNSSIVQLINEYHTKLAIWINQLDNAPGRQVWWNYWDVNLTYEKSYFARLKYTHTNPVHHKIVAIANQYPWCSAAWFERTATPSQVKTIYGFKIDKVNVIDDF